VGETINGKKKRNKELIRANQGTYPSSKGFLKADNKKTEVKGEGFETG